MSNDIMKKEGFPQVRSINGAKSDLFTALVNLEGVVGLIQYGNQEDQNPTEYQEFPPDCVSPYDCLNAASALLENAAARVERVKVKLSEMFIDK